MPDDPSKRGVPDGDCVNVHEEWELRHWARTFGVTERELRLAVIAVGTDAKDVETYLNRERGT